MDDISKDERFSHIAKDPRYRCMKRRERKVQIDKRFQGMFSDKQFKVKYRVDKRGRPIHSSTNENLKKYYELDDTDESSDSNSDEDEDKSTKVIKKNRNLETESIKTKKMEGKKGKLKQNTVERNQTKQKKKQKESTVLESTGKTKTKVNTAEEGNEKLKFGKEKKLTQLRKIESDGGGESVEDGSTSDSEEDTTLTSSNRDQDGEKKLSNTPAKTVAKTDVADETEESDSDQESEKEDIGKGPDLARGEGLAQSSSEDSDEEEDDDRKSDEFDHGWGELDKDAPEAEEITRRLAVCSMDWDRIKAQDLYVLLSSFKPTGGVIRSVKIYPSEFGLQRMKEEEVRGPAELVEQPLGSEEEETEDQEGSRYHREQLRRYQLNRLKYYYAVVDCDSPETANHIYEECDGLEYETSAAKLDLRFIPNEMTFDHEPKSVATDMPDVAMYKPSMFVTTALTQSKVDLTWDETDKDRVALTVGSFSKDEIDDMDVKAYLASSSGSEDEDPYGDLVQDPEFGNVEKDNEEVEETEEEEEKDDEDTLIDKYRNLVKGLQKTEKEKEDKHMEMEIKWEPGLKETTEDLIKKAAVRDEKLTPWEQYLQKKREKQKKKREKLADQVKEPEGDADNIESDEEIPAGVDLDDLYFKEELDKAEAPTQADKNEGSLKSGNKKKGKKGKTSLTPEEMEAKKQKEAELALLMMDEDDQRQHFNLQAIMENESGNKKKKKKRKWKPDVHTVEDTFKMKVDDPRFSAVFDSPAYNIDPSVPEFKKTKGMEALIQEKFKRSDQKTAERRKHIQGSPSKIQKLSTEGSTGNLAKDSSLSSLVKSVKAKTKTHLGKRTK